MKPQKHSFCTLVRSDARAFASRGGGYRVKSLILLALTPGFHFVFGIRAYQAAGRVPIIGVAIRRLLWFCHSLIFGSDVSFVSQIGGGLYVPHPVAIVIGEGVVIGERVTILQGVTIGNKSHDRKKCGRIGDDAYLGANACVIGDVTVGRGAVVGANAVVVKDVPAGASAVGNPARILAPKPPADQSRS